MKKSIIILFFLLTGCLRENIESINHCIILKQYCGFDNLDAGYYVVRDLRTCKIRRIDVDIRDCDVYQVGDTINN